MEHKRKTGACAAAIALAATLLPAAAAQAGDDASRETTLGSRALSTPCLSATGALMTVRRAARQDAAADTGTQSETERVTVEAADAPGVIGELLDLEGVPLVKLSDEIDRKIYFGISFDGVVGLHGKL